jgi:hypothetical protein
MFSILPANSAKTALDDSSGWQNSSFCSSDGRKIEFGCYLFEIEFLQFSSQCRYLPLPIQPVPLFSLLLTLMSSFFAFFVYMLLPLRKSQMDFVDFRPGFQLIFRKKHLFRQTAYRGLLFCVRSLIHPGAVTAPFPMIVLPIIRVGLSVSELAIFKCISLFVRHYYHQLSKLSIPMDSYFFAVSSTVTSSVCG